MKPAGSACLNCPARNAACVLPEFPRAPSPRLVFVGEGPGYAELRESKPLAGAPGRLLERGLRTLGLTRDDVHWTNAALCDVREVELPQARKACAERLRTELHALAASATEPLIVVPLGGYSLQTVLGLKRKPRIQRWRGSVTTAQACADLPKASLPHERIIVAPMLHPQYCQRVPAWLPSLEADFARVGRLLQSPYVPPELAPGREWVVAQSESELVRYLATLSPAVGDDVETVGLGPTQTELVCLALSDGALTVVIPWTQDSAAKRPWWNGHSSRVAQHITGILATRTAITHNGPVFDHIVQARYGIHHTAWEDTMLAAHVIDGHLPKRLQHVVTMHLDVPPWKEFDHAASIEKLWEYNARDTLYTKLTWDRMKAEFTA